MSPLTRRSDCGTRIAAAVSIRNGRGSMTHDCVLRFIPTFDTHAEAARFAAEQAVAWIEVGPADDCNIPITRN